MQDTVEQTRKKTRDQVREWRKRAVEKAGTKSCECGCGETIPAVRNDGKTPRRFAYGHNASTSLQPGETKENSAGYLVEYVVDPETGEAGWELQHRVVWERSNPRLKPGDALHHKNGKKQDNRLANLELVTYSEHATKHWRERWEGHEPQCTNIEHLRAERPSGGSTTPEQVLEIRQRIAAGETQQALCADMDLPAFTVSRIWSGKTWKCRMCEGKPPREKPSPPAGRRFGKRGAAKSAVLQIRVSNGEKVIIEERAEASGLTVSEFIRRAALSGIVPEPPQQKAAAPQPRIDGPDFEERVREMARRMSRRNAENLVRQEEARERS